ncbi:hypothetical protein FBU59_006727 [Linderina macrospora]|uniref:Uncharacterized protein n=1 Tax=Linderina macrospora TaxID=4868 RepID=A0ACC1IZ88_9FUNG|nr:hypothetical protein FBU59_006727 [Linderina macrospora]
MKSASWSKSQVPDIVSGDCEGRVTVFSMNQVFSRSTLSAPISAIALNSNPNSANSLVIGDLNGVVTACHAQETLWRTQIRPYVSSALIPSNPTLLNDTAITAICASQISDKHGMPTSYVLAATGSNQINILARSFSVMAIPTTAIVNSMCTGLFIQSSTMSASQVMVGDESGQLFVLDKFELIPYASVPHPVTRILAVPLSAFSDKPGPNVVVCQTRSDSVYVIYNRQIVYTLELGFWPVASDIILSEPSSDSPKVGVVVAENRLEDDGGSTVGALHMYSLDVAM